MEFIKREPAENYSGEFLKIKIEAKEKPVKLDNLLTVLNFRKLKPSKIKVISVTNNEEKTDVSYTVPEVNELFVLEFRNVDDIKEFKIKGEVESCKISILMNFDENYLQIKSDYTKHFKYKDLKVLIDKII